MSIDSLLTLSADYQINSINSINEKSKSIQSSSSELLIVTRSSSTLSAAWNTTNLIQGISILGIPYAMLTGSWIGIFFNLFAAFVCCSTGKMIIDCLYEKIGLIGLNVKVYDDYPDIGEKVWPKFGKIFVTTISVVDMFGVSTLYVILLGSSSYTLFKDILPNVTESEWYLICCSLIIFLLLIKQMSLISWFSLLAVMGLMGTILSLLIYCFTKYKLFKISNIPQISIQDIPISMGIIIFSYCAHPVLPAIEASMKNPGKFSLMMNISFFISVVTKIIFGIIPLIIFGKNTKQIITDNLSKNDYGFFISIRIFVLINVFFSMPLIIFILSQKMDDSLLKYFHNIFWPENKCHFIWILMTRLIIILSILLTSLIVPYFGLVMSFVGAFTGTCLTFIFPCWFSLVLKRNELNRLDKFYRISVIVCGIIFGGNGMVFAAKEMYRISKL